MITDIVIDLETLDTAPTAAVTQIGICAFCRNDRPAPKLQSRSWSVSIHSCLHRGLTVNQGTLLFWLKQSSTVGLPVWAENDSYSYDVQLETVLKDLTRFYASIVPRESDRETIRVWSHATFDIPILKNAFRATGLACPFHYRSFRDIRTLLDLTGTHSGTVLESSPEQRHDAGRDAEFEAGYIHKRLCNLDQPPYKGV